MLNLNLEIGVTSTVVAVVCVCAGATYIFLKHKYRLRDAVEALNYLIIKTVITEEACDEVVQELRKRIKHHRAIGFDCEWVTDKGKRQPVALVQLSTYDGFCGLFRLSHIKSVPNSLKDLLEDETIYKVGVAPYDDGKYLRCDYSVHLKSTLDIRHLAEVCGHEATGLGSLSKELLHIVLDKTWRIRCSDWEADTLTTRQINYAAADAHVSIKMFVHLVRKCHRGASASWFDTSSAWDRLDQLCWKYVDVNFRTKKKPKDDDDYKMKKRNSKCTEASSARYPHATRSKPLYHNCFMQAPDGEMLCTSDTKKALWYVEKELADVVSEDPLTVRLRFEPAGRSVGDVGRYYLLTKENKCVVCGGDRSYIRKNVVPREYRKYFPEIMKEHSSHDVVLLCVSCHKTSNMRDQAVRERLAVQCDAPLSVGANNKYREDFDMKKVKWSARALLYHSANLPEARRRQLEDLILAHYPQHEQITQELLHEAANLQAVFENASYESHGQKVTDYYVAREGGLLRLEQLWREHFLASMQPTHLPKLWSVTHNEEKMRIKFNEGRLSERDMKLVGLTGWI